MALSTKNPLTTTALLLHLELCSWSGEVKDKKALQAVAKQFKSDVHRDKYLKSLFVDDPLAQIHLCAGRLRNHFYTSSYQWLDGGKGRLMPARSFEEFADKFTVLKNDFYKEVDHFLDNYADHKALAKQRKGDLYNEAEYPDVSTLRERFSVKLHALPFPDTEDFRIDAPDHVIAELEKEMKDAVDSVKKVVEREIEERFKARLNMLIKTLTVGKRFNTSLLTELESVIDMALHLEETLSKGLVKRLRTAKDHILGHSPEQIRNSVTLQEELVNTCQKLL